MLYFSSKEAERKLTLAEKRRRNETLAIGKFIRNFKIFYRIQDDYLKMYMIFYFFCKGGGEPAQSFQTPPIQTLLPYKNYQGGVERGKKGIDRPNIFLPFNFS